jgi:DNA-binding PadR family transcriptional regulator
MAIEPYQRDRIELEQAVYRSARHLGECASWLFWDDNMDRAIADGFFEKVDNGAYKVSSYYRLTSKGKSELKKVGPGFTYADARGRVPVDYCRAGSHGTRWVRITHKERQTRASRVLAAYRGVVTAATAHQQLNLEKKGWFPAKTTRPPQSLIKDGLIERQWRGAEGKTAYYRLTPKGKKALVEARLQKLKVEQAQARRELRSEQAAARRRLPRETDVRHWGYFPE